MLSGLVKDFYELIKALNISLNLQKWKHFKFWERRKSEITCDTTKIMNKLKFYFSILNLINTSISQFSQNRSKTGILFLDLYFSSDSII